MFVCVIVYNNSIHNKIYKVNKQQTVKKAKYFRKRDTVLTATTQCR